MPRILAAALACLAAAAGQPDEPAKNPVVDERLIPSDLTGEPRQTLIRYLTDHAKRADDRVVPEGAKVINYAPKLPVLWDSEPRPGVVIREYLVAVVPHRRAGKAEAPARVTLTWFREHPEKGKPGVTVRRVLDLNSGEQVGETEALCYYPTPLSREELRKAVRLAREAAGKVRDLYAKTPEKDITVSHLVEHQIDPGRAGVNPGDRVAVLIFRAKGLSRPLSARVNITQERVLTP
ncbi:MAG TPA: hypothetical protein VIL46_06500 [Gemmataceae bacterium]